MNKKDIDPANAQVPPMNKEDVGAIAVIDSQCIGAPRPEHYRQKLGSAIKRAGISTSLVAEARTSTSQDDCKG